MIGFTVAGAGLAAWFLGFTLLQARALTQPFDTRLGALTLVLTLVAFRLVALFMLAKDSQIPLSPLVAAGDVSLTLLIVYLIGRRINSESPYILSASLVLAGSALFWLWYVENIGGLLITAP